MNTGPSRESFFALPASRLNSLPVIVVGIEPDVPVLAITDSMASPLARNSSLYFVVRDADVHRFRPLAAPIVLAQSLIIALGYYRDARIAQAAKGARKPPG